MIAELRKAIPFIEDMELREMTEELLKKLGKTEDEVFEDVSRSVNGEAIIESAE